MWPQAKYSEKLRAKEIYLLCRSAQYIWPSGQIYNKKIHKFDFDIIIIRKRK